MRLKTLFLASSLLVSLAGRAAQDPVDYVNPLMGTDSSFELSSGNTYPAIAMPWGMNFWMPQTGGMGDGWAYVYGHHKIRGFKQTHQPSPWINDYGQFSILPETGEAQFHQDRRASWFSHKAEVAKPYYYSVYLADYDVTAELAPTERACAMRFTYPTTDKASVVIDAFDRGSHVKVIPEKNMVVGYTTRNSGGVPQNFKNYFVLVFDHPFQSWKLVDVKAEERGDRYKNCELKDGTELTAHHTGAIVEFQPTQRGEVVNVRVASSFISEEQAMENLKELGTGGFDQVKEQGRARWNEVLGRLKVEDDNIDHVRTFYSCLYRSVLFPRCFAENTADGQVMHYSPYNGETRPGYLYTDMGFWDVFRCLLPLVNLVYPSVGAQMQEGWVNTYLESGFLPEWASPGHRGCMVGNNSASVVADAYLKGLRGCDAETLWKALVHGANAVHPHVQSTGRYGFEYYNKLGYVPYDVKINESVARTLEYAYDDWCIYKFGQALGKSKKELEPFRKHAMNYKNVFDKETRMMRGRNLDGKFQSPFSPYKWGDAFTEGNSWHWTWCVFHDPQGLINLMGGKEQFNQMMDSVFVVPPIFDDSYYGGVIHEIREMQIMNMGNYAHGNQPIQHMLYLYDWSGQPWKGQYWIREAMNKLYTSAPDGYCGDEDNGQTSAWYVFSSMGFYPVCPGRPEYAIGTPYFKKITLSLENGRTMVFEAPDNSCQNRYVDQVQVNGVPYDNNYFTQDQLMQGGTIRYTMSAKPNMQRGTSESAAPYSFSKEK